MEATTISQSLDGPCQGPFRMSLADFLHQSHSSLMADSSSSSNCFRQYVVGNQAGDADSIISALALAYIDSMAPAAAEKGTKDVMIMPIVSVAQADFKFRQETVRLLELAAVTNGDRTLYFMDQLLESCATKTASTDNNMHHDVVDNNDNMNSIILVDHNRLDPSLELARQWTVVEILDHHLDEGLYQDTVMKSRRNVAYHDNQALVASTCTLVTERLVSHQALLPPPYPADLAMALLGVIVLDTLNMSPDAGKGTQRDQAAIDTLMEKTNWGSISSNRNHNEAFQKIMASGDSNNGVWRPDLSQLFELLQSAKFDPLFWKSLSARDALRLDYKQFTAGTTSQQQEHNNHVVFGVSTILMPMDDFLIKGDVWQSISNYMKEQDVAILGVMTACTNQEGNLERELLICSFEHHSDLLISLAMFLSFSNTTLGLTEAPVTASVCHTSQGDGPNDERMAIQMRRFRQGNAKASRKQVVPIMMQFFESGLQ